MLERDAAVSQHSPIASRIRKVPRKVTLERRVGFVTGSIVSGSSLASSAVRHHNCAVPSQALLCML